MPVGRFPLAFAAVLASFGPAFAHAFLTSAVPAVGATVRTAPTAIVINYSEGVEPSFSTIEVQDSSGIRVDTGDVHTDPNDDKRLIVGLKPLQPGSYKVIWHVTSVDTHKTEGSYGFTVSP